MSANIILCETGYYRSACVECQRRKQKCNREWPCDSCRRRKVPDGCRYNDSNLSPEVAGHEVKHGKSPRPRIKLENRKSVDSNGDDGVFEALAERAFASLGIDANVKMGKRGPKQDLVRLDSTAQLERVLKMLPQRRVIDHLIQIFLSDVNYHYYIIYPPSFLHDYDIWWTNYSQRRPISLQFTLLLAMICSCTLQHVEFPLQESLKTELGQTTEAYSHELHKAVRELASVIHIGHYHVLNVQRLLHSCYWYKTEAQFVEAWHVLSQAIVEARELSLHLEAPRGSIAEFDREMRRRLWCILDTWDWQISSGLSRPKLIDRAVSTVALPELILEGVSPSPLEHMKMQSELTRQLASRFNAPKNIITPEDIHEYKDLIVNWMARFPPEYDFYSPDTSKDDLYPWIIPHRFYVYTMACLLVLNPIRHYMVKSYTWNSPRDELEVRNIGVFYSLVLIQTLRRWVDRVSGRDGRLHFIIFSIFDTGAILCTAVLKDEAKTLPRETEILEALSRCIIMLKTLMNISKTAKMSHDILHRLIRKLPQSAQKTAAALDSANLPRKRAKVGPLSVSATNGLSKSSASSIPVPEPALMAPAMHAQDVMPEQPARQPSNPAIHNTPSTTSVSNPSTHHANVAYNTASYGVNKQQARHFTPPSSASYIATPHYATTPAVQHPSLQGLPQVVVQRPSLGVANPLHDGQPPLLVPQTFSSQINNQIPAVATYWDADTPPPFPAPYEQQAEHEPPVTTYGMVNNALPAPVEGQTVGYGFMPPTDDCVPDLNLANLTDAQLGGLAPLWNWHSSNIDWEAVNQNNGQYGQ